MIEVRKITRNQLDFNSNFQNFIILFKVLKKLDKTFNK
jgi:hypothetical protein